MEREPIYVDAKGRPFERPKPLSKNATTKEKIAHMRAMNEYRDKITDYGNKQFVEHFRKAMEKK